MRSNQTGSSSAIESLFICVKSLNNQLKQSLSRRYNQNSSEAVSDIASQKKNKTFCGFSMGRNQYWAGRVYDLCVYYMTGTPEGSTESGFMEKPGIEPATPGLQGLALIHYTTGASLYQIGQKNDIAPINSPLTI